VTRAFIALGAIATLLSIPAVLLTLFVGREWEVPAEVLNFTSVGLFASGILVKCWRQS
jgi:hypothetical protein